MNEKTMDALLKLAFEEMAEEELSAAADPKTSTPVVGEKTINKCKRMIRWAGIRRSAVKVLKAVGTVTAACFIMTMLLFTSALSVPPERDFFCMVNCKEDAEGYHMYFDLEVTINLWKDRKPRYIPKGWTIEKKEESDGVFGYDIYGPGNEYISFKQYYNDFEVTLNKIPEFERITLKTGVECGYYRDGNKQTFMWYNDACLYWVRTWDIDKDLVIEIIESIR